MYRTQQGWFKLGVPRGGQRLGATLVLLPSEGQMSDFIGAAMMIDAFSEAEVSWVTGVTTQTGSAKP